MPKSQHLPGQLLNAARLPLQDSADALDVSLVLLHAIRMSAVHLALFPDQIQTYFAHLHPCLTTRPYPPPSTIQCADYRVETLRLHLAIREHKRSDDLFFFFFGAAEARDRESGAYQLLLW